MLAKVSSAELEFSWEDAVLLPVERRRVGEPVAADILADWSRSCQGEEIVVWQLVLGWESKEMLADGLDA